MSTTCDPQRQMAAGAAVREDVFQDDLLRQHFLPMVGRGHDVSELCAGFQAAAAGTAISTVPSSPTDPHLFKEETAESYEAGFKLDLFDATLRLNGAIFTTDYKNMQFTYRIGVAPFLFNTGKATINGGELELTWIPVEALIVEGGVGYLDGEIKEVDTLINAVTGVSTSNKLPFTPSWQASLGVGYRIIVGDDWRLTPRVDGFYQTRTYFDEGNTRQIAQLDPVKTVSASVSLESPGERWRVVAAGRNLSDERYSQGGNPSFTELERVRRGVVRARA